MELRNKSLRKENLPRLEDDTYVPTEQDYSDANNKIKEAKDRFELSMKIMGSDLGLNENPLAEKESIYTRGKENPMSLDRVLYPNRQNFADGPEDPSKKGLGSLTKRNFLKILSLIPAGILAVRGGPNLLKKAKNVKEAVAGVPQHFTKLYDKIKLEGFEIASYAERVRQYIKPSKDGKSELMLTEDLGTGDIQIKKIYPEDENMNTKVEQMNFSKGQADEATKGTPADEYEEVTEINSRIQKDEYNDPDYEDGIDVEDIMKEIDD